MASTRDALLRFTGQYGVALDGAGKVISDVVEVTATIEVNRIEVPLVGQTKQGYKAGRESREGSLNFQKIDSRWEYTLWSFLYRRQEYLQNPTGTAPQSPQFSLAIAYRDPDAAGPEKWQLTGCQIWRASLGFNITEDVVGRELPFTWESESPVEAFKYVSTSSAGAITKESLGTTPTAVYQV